MTLRASALVAGLLGLVLLVVGLIADSRRPDADVVVSHTIDTPVVVVGPEVIGLEPLRRIAVDGEGDLLAHSARPVDAQAWLATRDATEVTGFATWEEISLRDYVAPEPTTEPSPSPSPSGSPEPTPSASPSPSPSPSPEAQAEEEEPIDASSRDHWRQTWVGTDRLAVLVSAIPAGESFVIESADGGPLGAIHLYAERDPNDAWVTPLIVWGALLLLIGIGGVIYTLVDLRPWQRKGEEWASKRAAKGEPKEGSRRARRLAGAQIPVAELEADTAAVPKAKEKGGEK